MDPGILLGPKERRSNEIRKLSMADSQFPMQFHHNYPGIPTNGYELFSMFGAPDPNSSRDSTQSSATTPKPLTKRQIEYRRLKESPEEYRQQLEKMRVTRRNYYRRFRSNPVKWQEHLKRVAERRHNMPAEKVAIRLQKQREWRRANYMEARQDPEKWKAYLKKRSEERRIKKERIRNGEFSSDASAATSLNVTGSSNETEYGGATPDSQHQQQHHHNNAMAQAKWNAAYYPFGAPTPVSMKLQGPMDSVAESALPFSLSALLEPNVQVVEQEHHQVAAGPPASSSSSSGNYLNIPKIHKYEDYMQRPSHMFASKQIPNTPQHNNSVGGSYHKQSSSGNASTSSAYNNHKQSAAHGNHNANSSSYNYQKHSTTVHPNHAHQSSTPHNGFHKHQQQLPPPASTSSLPNNGMFQKQPSSSSSSHHQLPPAASSNHHHHQHHNLNNGGNMFQDYLQKLTAGQQRSPAKKQELPIPAPGYFDMNNMSQHFSQQYGQSPYRFTPTPQFAAYAANAAAANHVHEPVPRYKQEQSTAATLPQQPTQPQPLLPQATPKKLTRRQMELRRLKESPEKYRDFLQKQRESRKKGYLKCREDPLKWQEHLVKVSEKRKQKKMGQDIKSAPTSPASSSGGHPSTQGHSSTSSAQAAAASAAAAAAAAMDHHHKTASFAVAASLAVASGNLNLSHRMDGNLDLSDHSLLPYALRTML